MTGRRRLVGDRPERTESGISDATPDKPTDLTWAALLGRWVEFARGALALPDDETGRRLRDSVADIVMLQAVWFALRQIDELNEDQRALGLDRAEVLIDKHGAALRERWRGDEMPAQIAELIRDAEQALQHARP